jgi:hypothetical protein
MATVDFFRTPVYLSTPLAPGSYYWLSWTWEPFGNGAITMTPSGYARGQTVSMYSGPVYVSRTSFFGGDIEYWEYQAGAAFYNGGQVPVQGFAVSVSVIRA